MRISDWSSDVCSSDLAAHDDHVGGTSCEQADADDPGDLVELAFEHQRLGDGQAVHVEDPVAVVGFHAFAPDRLRAGGGHDRARDQAASHRDDLDWQRERSEEHTSELQSLMRNSYAVFCLKKKKPVE